MRTPAADLLLPLAAVSLSVAFAAATSAPPLDILFVAVVLTSLLLLARTARRARQEARRARELERETAAVRPTDVARHAVTEERLRLSAEIDVSVRRSLERVRRMAAAAETADDPVPLFVDIQDEARSTMTDLRRQLGLLVDDVAPPPQVSQQPAPAPARGRRVHDLLIVSAVVALAVVENVISGGSGWEGLMTTVPFAATTAIRRRAAAASALAAACLLALGAVLDLPVQDGLAFPVVVGLLLWALLTAPASGWSVAVAALLYATAVTSRMANDPDNAPINAVIGAVVAVVAVMVGRARRARAISERQAMTHRSALESAREDALRAERRAIARELHDVASHAVGLVAVQAGAAELSWERDPAAARARIVEVRMCVEDALRQIGADHIGEPPAVTWDDTLHLLTRIEAAGMRIRLTCPVRPPVESVPIIYRIIQEALTNVLRHAPGAQAVVDIVVGRSDMHVAISDDGPGPGTGAGGYGLTGLADRVTDAGGRLVAGRGDLGGFVVRATLPLDAKVDV